MDLLKSEKGNEIIAFFALFPILFLLTINILLLGSYHLDQSDLSNIVTNYHNKILLKGQLTTEEETSLLQELENKGYDLGKIEIVSEPVSVRDNNDSTYVKRYDDITFGIIYKKPHPYFYVSKLLSPSATEDIFYTGNTFTGMSEKW